MWLAIQNIKLYFVIETVICLQPIAPDEEPQENTLTSSLWRHQITLLFTTDTVSWAVKVGLIPLRRFMVQVLFLQLTTQG